MNVSDFGICLREYGLVSSPADGSRGVVPLGEHRASCRKGEPDYAKRLLRELGNPSQQDIDSIFVVGDGIGDVRFAEHLLEIVGPQSGGIRVEGYFRGHPEINAAVKTNDEFYAHPHWKSLCRDFDLSLARSKRALVFVDIDRTIIYPRGVATEEYRALRKITIFDFISEFSLFELDQIDFEKVGSYSDEFVDSFEGYGKNESASIVFKNEETIACLALLRATGLVNFLTYSSERLDENLRIGLGQAKQGGWISGLCREFDDADRVEGEANWDKLGLLQTLNYVQESMASDRPVLLPRFREVEAGNLERMMCKASRNLWNDPLLEVLGRAANCTVVFLSDRPAVSLGEPYASNGSVPSGFFAQKLARKLSVFRR